MGGTGSGRWGGYEKKRTTEESWMLDMRRLWASFFAARSIAASCDAVRIEDGALARVSFVLLPVGVMGVDVKISFREGSGLLGRRVEQRIPLRPTFPHVGGIRWYFSCPIEKEDGEPCARRAQKLYRPLGAKLFGCRKCHDLTYESCQRSRAYDSLHAKIMPGATDEEPLAMKQTINTHIAENRRAREQTKSLVEVFDEFVKERKRR